MPLQYQNNYQTTEILTADPGKLVLLLYEGAISFLRQGREKLEKKDYKEKGRLLMRAHDIIAELLNSLDYEKGGEVSQRLKALYTYMMKRVVDADFYQDTEAIDEVLSYLTELNKTWQEVINRNREENPVHQQDRKKEIVATI